MLDVLHILLDKNLLKKKTRKISISVFALQIKKLKLREIKITNQSDAGMVHSKDLIQKSTPRPTFFPPNHSFTDFVTFLAIKESNY